MKKDIDRLMSERGIDALAVCGTPKQSSDLYYFTGNIAVSGCWLFKQQGDSPVLLAGSMEREEAAKSGLAVRTWEEFGSHEIYREAKDALDARVKLLDKVFQALAIKGTVSFCGTGDIPFNHALLKALTGNGAINVHVEPFDSILSEARMTKDNDEIETIESVVTRAQEVMAAIREFFTTCTAKDGKIVDQSGKDVTIGRVKAMIDAETRDRNLMLDEEVIFSQGYDSAIPHSRGNDESTLVPGRTIIFDYCPQQAGGGYFADITRTWCLGHVPEEVQQTYDHVREIVDKVLDDLEVGKPSSVYDVQVNDFFSSHGHPTPSKNPGTTEGYVHSLGHGIGLQIHERPRLSMFSKTEENLVPGYVFTVEPGLYYPDKEIGVRLEDDVAIKEDGSIENLCPLSKELLIPLS